MRITAFAKIINLALLCLIWVICTFAQDVPEDAIYVPSVEQIVQVPKSPEAASFAKYGDNPVSLHTGTPQISIPLGDLQGREITIPITLDYDASGIKVDQVASWVGLGWNLNVGGAIVRQVAGLPDGYGNLADPVSTTYRKVLGIPGDKYIAIEVEDSVTNFSGRIFDPEMQSYLDYLKENNLTEGSSHPTWIWDKSNAIDDYSSWQLFDLAPDVFSFSALGISGTIVINYQKNEAYCVENPSLKIDFTLNEDRGEKVDVIQEWQITDEFGSKYFFKNKEYTSNLIELGVAYIPSRQEYISSWNLTRVISSNQKDIVDFMYTDGVEWESSLQHIQRFQGSTYTYPSFQNTCGTPGDLLVGLNTTNTGVHIRQAYLSQILINGKLAATFELGENRVDIPAKRILDKIGIYDLGSSVKVATIDFENQAYFTALPTQTGIGEGVITPRTEPPYTHRVKLDGLNIMGHGIQSGDQEKSYSFTYFGNGNIPNLHSNAVDYWGYYNGEETNPNLVPKMTLEDGTVLEGADREPRLAFTQIGTLSKIQYPTGGYSEFSFGLHEQKPGSAFIWEILTESLGGIQAGIDAPPIDTYCEIDDISYPFSYEGAFILNEENKDSLKLRLNFSRSGSSDQPQYAIIYRSGEGECFGANRCNYGESLPFCDLFNAGLGGLDGKIVHFQKYLGQIELEIGINISNWQKGAYRILLINTDPNLILSAKTIKRVLVPNIKNIKVGGLRIYKMVDFVDTNQAAKTTYYYYNDLSKIDQSRISPSLFIGDYESSGIEQLPLLFHSLGSHTFIPGEEELGIGFPPGVPITCSNFNRSAKNLKQTLGSHITYSTVSVASFDGNNHNGYTVNEFYNSKTPNHEFYFKTNLKNGQSKRIAIYHQNGSKLQETFFKVSENPVLDQISSVGLHLKYSGNSSLAWRVLDFGDYPDGIVPNNQEPEGRGEVGMQFYQLFHPPNNPVSSTPALFTDPCSREDLWRECGTRPETFPVDRTRILYANAAKWLRQDTIESIFYTDEGSVSTRTIHYYDNPIHKQLTRTEIENSDGKIHGSKIYYPDDIHSLSYYPNDSRGIIELMNKENLHRIATPIATEQYIGTKKVSRELTEFGDFGIEPGIDGNAQIQLRHILPVAAYFSLEDKPLERRLNFPHYGKGGNIQEVFLEGDETHTVYIWGYDYRVPVAKIIAKGATSSNLGFEESSIQNLKGSALQSALSGLRSKYTEGFVTTFSYNDRLQVESVTDPNGRTTRYRYDGLGRLIEVKDHKGNVVQEMEYNYGKD